MAETGASPMGLPRAAPCALPRHRSGLEMKRGSAAPAWSSRDRARGCTVGVGVGILGEP